MSKLIKQFLKFGIVGVINTVNSWIVYYILIFIKTNYLIATTIAYFISSIIGYLLNKKWVFKKKENNIYSNSVLKYYIVYISSYLLTMLCMYIFVDVLNISKLIAPVLVLFITVPYNFVFSKLWVFKHKINEDNINNSKKLHTFAICAYKSSQYLEDCIKSVINQEVKSNCIIFTSTPNETIESLAKKYNLEYVIRDGKSDIQDDWNFAYNNSKTPLVTIAHQDDVYEKDYLKNILINYDSNALIYCTDYNPLKNSKIVKDTNSKIKRILRLLIANKQLSNTKLFKILSLAFGNSINCPSVTYNKEKLGENVFTSDLKFALDWDTFLKIARKKGRFVYIPKSLIRYRIHDGATTKQFIVDNKRKEEDIIMFNKIWPKFITKILMKIYIKCYDTYN